VDCGNSHENAAEHDDEYAISHDHVGAIAPLGPARLRGENDRDDPRDIANVNQW
jgi:hypothetical protein